MPGVGTFGGGHPTRIAYQGMGLITAASEGYLPIVVLLWGTGEDVQTCEQDGYSALHFAALHGHLPVVRFLLDQKMNADVDSPDGITPIMWAAASGHWKVCGALLNAGASLTKKDHRGYNALHHAVHRDQLETLHFLIQCDSSKSAHLGVDLEEHNIMHWAAYRGCLPTVRYLVEAIRMNLNIIDGQHRTALHWAAREGRTAVVRYLLSKGAAQSNNQDGLTAEQEARDRFHQETVKVFAEYKKCSSSVSSSAFASGTETVPYTSLAVLRTFPMQYAHIAGAILYISFIYFASTHLPIHLMLVSPSLFSSKLLLKRLSAQKDGVRGGVDVNPVHPQINMIREFLGGPKIHNYRDLWSITAIITATLVQLKIGVLSTEFNESVFAESSFWKTLSLLSLLASCMCIFMVKWKGAAHASARPNVKDWSLLQSTATSSSGLVIVGSHCVETGNRKTLRSAFVLEVNSIVHRFDHFSYWIDEAIGLGNHHYYLLGVMFYAVFQAINVWVLLAWSKLGASGLASKDPSDSTIWNVFVHMIPCGASKPPDGWTFLIPTLPETAGFWLMVGPLVALLLLARSLLHGFLYACVNITAEEMSEKACRGEGGVNVPVYIQNPGRLLLQTVFTEGSVGRNLLVFFGFRKSYRSWETMDELPRVLWVDESPGPRYMGGSGGKDHRGHGHSHGHD